MKRSASCCHINSWVWILGRDLRVAGDGMDSFRVWSRWKRKYSSKSPLVRPDLRQRGQRLPW